MNTDTHHLQPHLVDPGLDPLSRKHFNPSVEEGIGITETVEKTSATQVVVIDTGYCKVDSSGRTGSVNVTEISPCQNPVQVTKDVLYAEFVASMQGVFSFTRPASSDAATAQKGKDAELAKGLPTVLELTSHTIRLEDAVYELFKLEYLMDGQTRSLYAAIRIDMSSQAYNIKRQSAEDLTSGWATAFKVTQGVLSIAGGLILMADGDWLKAIAPAFLSNRMGTDADQIAKGASGVVQAIGQTSGAAGETISQDRQSLSGVERAQGDKKGSDDNSFNTAESKSSDAVRRLLEMLKAIEDAERQTIQKVNQ